MKFLEEFIGRDLELAALDEAWAEVRGGAPRWVLLLGDSGLGKTRLVHEFYRRIVAQDGAGGYWPAQLDTNPATLRINPAREARKREIEDMHWFWWGLRWPPPGTKVGGRHYCALLEQEAKLALAAHTGPWRNHRARAHHVRGFGKDMALNLAGQLAASSLLGPLAPVAGALLGPGKTLMEIGTGTSRWAQLARTDGEVDPGEASGRDGEADTRDFLASLLDASPPFETRRPVILVLDDAQWADEHTLGFVRDLFADAQRYHWPLMVIATCWETEWKQQCPRPGSDVLSLRPMNLAELFGQLGRLLPSGSSDFSRSPFCRRLVMSRFGDGFMLRPVIRRAFPGLGRAAQEYLLQQADGNPRVLAELLQQLEDWGTSDWFRNGDRANDLTPVGLQRLKALPTQFESILLNRISRLERQSPQIYRTLVLAASQGLRFHGRLVSEVGESLSCLEPGGVFDHLGQAETPCNMVSLLPGKTWPGQFKEPFAWRRFADSCGQVWPQAGTQLRRVLLNWLERAVDHDLEHALGYLELLAAHLRAPDATPQERDFWPQVMGRLVVSLQALGRLGTAAERAMELVAQMPLTDTTWLRRVGKPAWLPVGAALFEACDFDDVERLAALVFDQENESIVGTERAAWLELRARAAHFRENAKAAIIWWKEAIAVAESGGANAQSWDAQHLRLGLANSLYQAEGGAQAGDIFESIAVAVPVAEQRRMATGHLLLLGLACEGLAATRYDAGDLEGAIEAMSRGCRVLALCGQRPDAGAEVTKALIHCLRELGRWQLRLIGGAAEDAEANLRRAAALQEGLMRRTGMSTHGLVELAMIQTSLARAVSRNSGEEALRVVGTALAIREEVLLRAGERTDTLRGLAITLFCRGQIYLDHGQTDKAVEEFERVRGLRLTVVAAGHDDSRRLLSDQRMLVHAGRFCGESLRRAGLPAEARIRLEEALAVNRRILRRQPREAEDLRIAYQLWESFGRLAAGQRHRVRAIRCYRLACAWLKRLEHAHGLAQAGEVDRERLEQALRNLSKVEADQRQGVEPSSGRR